MFHSDKSGKYKSSINFEHLSSALLHIFLKESIKPGQNEKSLDEILLIYVFELTTIFEAVESFNNDLHP